MRETITNTHLTFTVIILISVLLSACKDDISGTKNENQPPNTSLFIETDDTLNSTSSIQTFYWDGQDADGFITGFYYAFGNTITENDWVWTTERKMTFPLKISGQDTTYIFKVKAVDNEGSEDPTPATQSFPIKNSPPQIGWQINNNIPDTTFTVASFAWTVSDLDGDMTVVLFEYAIDDTANWLEIAGSKRTLTLRETDGITEGDHAFFIRAVDVAGSKSSIIRMPEDPAKFWYVKNPAGRYLLIDDFGVESSTTAFPDAYYKSMLDKILLNQGEKYSTWNIEEQFPASNTQFKETLLLFDRIVWYTDLIGESDPHFIAAQIAIPEFRNKGGKIIFSVQFNKGFGSQGSPLEFSPVEALGDPFNVIISNSLYYPDTTFNTAADGIFSNIELPELKVSTFIVGLNALIPKTTSIPMYRYDVANNDDDPIFILIGKNDNSQEYDFVFAGTPMHFLNGNDNLDDLFEIILTDIFGL